MGGTLYADGIAVHPSAEATVSSWSAITGTYSIPWSSGRRTFKLLVTNFQSTGNTTLPSIYFGGTGNTYSGYTCGNNGGAVSTWGTSIQLYNAAWATTYQLNFVIEIEAVSNTVYMVHGYGYKIEANYFINFFGTIFSLWRGG